MQNENQDRALNDTAPLPASWRALRPYQRQRLERLRQRYRDGKRRLLVSLPTGTGKTVIFAQFPHCFRMHCRSAAISRGSVRSSRRSRTAAASRR